MKGPLARSDGAWVLYRQTKKGKVTRPSPSALLHARSLPADDRDIDLAQIDADHPASLDLDALGHRHHLAVLRELGRHGVGEGLAGSQIGRLEGPHGRGREGQVAIDGQS